MTVMDHLGAILSFESCPDMPGMLKMPGQAFLHFPRQRSRQLPPVMCAGTEDAGMSPPWDPWSVSAQPLTL